MTIFAGSRYANTDVYERDGNTVFKIRRRYEFSDEGCENYIWTEPDTLDGLAKARYNDEQLWWVVMEANPHLSFPWDLTPGDTILLPTLEEVERVYGRS